MKLGNELLPLTNPSPVTWQCSLAGCSSGESFSSRRAGVAGVVGRCGANA